MREGWPTLIPLILLIGIITSGRTPYNGRILGDNWLYCRRLSQPPQSADHLHDLYDAFRLGAKYALAVGASAAAVGIIVGVVSLTGMGFKISFMVTSASQSAGRDNPAVHTFQLASLQLASPFF